MGKLTADFLLERLAENGVRRIYGYPGDGINAIIGALERHKDKLKFVQVRHEEQAAFMACAHAKWTGEVGVCLATSGPGAIHLLNGLYDAKLDHQPVMAIVGQQARMGLGSHYQQEVDLQTLFKDVAHEYVQTAMEATQIRHLVGLVGDAKATLKELIPLIEHKSERAWREQLEEEIKEWWRLLEERAMQEADPINPQRLFWELNKYLPPNAIITSDS